MRQKEQLQARIALLLATFTLPPAATGAAAVETTNYAISGSASRSTVGQFDGTTKGLGGGVTVPAGEFLGLSLSGGYSWHHADYPDNSCDTRTGVLGAGLFFRQPDIGRLGLDYAHAESEYCDVFGDNTSPKPDFQTDQYSLSAEYYLSAVTLGLSRSQSRLQHDFGADVVSDWAFAQGVWYADPNFKLGLSAGALDSEDTYAAFAAYQPQVLGRKVSLSLRYSEQQDVDARTTTITLSYFFDQAVDLKTRDRRLR